MSPPTPVFDTNEASKSAVIEKDSDEESTTTAKDLNSELHSTRKPSDENNNDSPSQIEEQSISELVNHEEVKPKSPLNSNGKQSSIVILEDIMLSTLPNEINSPQSPNTSTSTTVIPPIIFPTPTNGHVLPATHINFSLLQPWLNKRSHNKYAISCHTQLQKNGLRAKYRCMGSTCSFYTSEKGLYRLHLKRHIHNENNNIDTFLYCSNCIYSTNDIDKLVNHVTIVHRFDRYQCPYCFYRSVEKQSCLTHVEKYHRYNEKCIMECPIDDTPTNAEKLRDKLHAYRLKHVAPFRCPSKFKLILILS